MRSTADRINKFDNLKLEGPNSSQGRGTTIDASGTNHAQSIRSSLALVSASFAIRRTTSILFLSAFHTSLSSSECLDHHHPASIHHSPIISGVWLAVNVPRGP